LLLFFLGRRSKKSLRFRRLKSDPGRGKTELITTESDFCILKVKRQSLGLFKTVVPSSDKKKKKKNNNNNNNKMSSDMGSVFDQKNLSFFSL